jgi:trans-aconitate methyltransferase
MPALTSEQARRVYDRVGRAQDWQRFYEDAATADLVAHAGFDAAHSIVELGCGTGRLAAGHLTRLGTCAIAARSWRGAWRQRS